MTVDITDPISWAKRPEYTGENRCMRCTAVNSTVVVIAAIALWTFVDPIIPMGLLIVGFLSIYLRGYLIPGTPTLTKRYFPEEVLQFFDGHAETDHSGDDVDLETVLLDADVLEECDRGDDLCLTESFKWELHEEIDTVRNDALSRSILSELLDVDQEELQFQSYGDAYEMYVEEQKIGTWESEAAFFADVAGAKILPDWTPAWEDLSPNARSSLLASLRLFLENCPACGGPVRLHEETVESCCREIDVVAVSCIECESRLLEIRDLDGVP